MAWNKTINLYGHEISLFGWGKDVSLQLSADDIINIGSDKKKIFKWFLKNHAEIGLVEFWDEAHYDQQFFTPEELRVILNSQFADDRDRKAAYNAINGIRQPRPTPPPKIKIAKIGFVYLLKSANWYKIGKTINLDSRILAISPALPHRIELIHSIRSDRYSELEIELHDRFSDKRLNGEWFALDAQDVEYIKGI